MEHAQLLGTVVALWVALLLFWGFMAIGAKPRRIREPALSQMAHRIPLTFAILLLMRVIPLPSVLNKPFVPSSLLVEMIGTLVILIGLGLAAWARWNLGSNWSGSITFQQGHALVCTGIYRFVRHPIYTGLLLAFIGTAVVIDETRYLLAFVLVFVAFIYKSKAEERLMRNAFPDYDAYCKKTRAFIPLVF